MSGPLPFLASPGRIARQAAGAFGSLLTGQRPGDIGFSFRVVSPDMLIGDFQSIEGLSRSIKAEEYFEGGKNDGPHQFIGQVQAAKVTLKTGEMDRNYLYDWVNGVKVGQEFKQDLIILQYTRSAWPLRVYHIQNCWPTEWKGADLDASQSALPIEQITLQCDRIEMYLMPEVIGNMLSFGLDTLGVSDVVEDVAEWGSEELASFQQDVREWVRDTREADLLTTPIGEWGSGDGPESGQATEIPTSTFGDVHNPEWEMAEIDTSGNSGFDPFDPSSW